MRTIFNIIFVFFLILLFQSCIIKTKQKYNESKLSKIIDQQIKETIDIEIVDDIILLKNRIVQIEKTNNYLKKLCDSLIIQNSNKPQNGINLNTYLFFSSSYYHADVESIKQLKNTILSLSDTINLNKFKFHITGYSDASGDSTINITLAHKRALHAREILIKDFCVSSDLITYQSIPNVISCNNSFYRSVKINIYSD